LATRWYGREDEVAEPIVRRITGARADSRRMTLEIEVAAEYVLNIPPVARERTMLELSKRWRQISEPEIRIALARLLGRARVDQD
jgi:hypothetical protein